MNPIIFEPPHSRFDPSFWEELYNKKLNDYKLERIVYKPIENFFEFNDNFSYIGNTYFCKSSFNTSSDNSYLIVFNSPDDYKATSKLSLIKKFFLHFYIKKFLNLKDSIENSNFLRFSYLLTCPDLKHYKFSFW